MIKEIQANVDQFLRTYRMNPEMVDLRADTENFIGEMRLGLTDQPESLRMLCTYIQANGKIPEQEPVIVMDAGGTNFRVALVTFDEGQKPVIESFHTHPMPGTHGEISREEFFRTIVRYLEPVIDRSSRIGFCFSFPTIITPERDGILIAFDKEVLVRDMEYVRIGESLKAALKEAGVKGEKEIVLLNDTVAALLGGKAANPGRTFSSFIGFILGTGTNTCYVEANGNILKHPDVAGRPGSTIINIESGGYGKISRGEFDLRVDRTARDPGAQKLEKMISGVYIGRVLLEMLSQAAQDGLFTEGAAARILGLKEISGKEIDDFCFYPASADTTLGSCVNLTRTEEDVQNQLTLYFLIDSLFERAARIVAVNLAAVISQSGQGTNPCYPVLITAEGTTFYKAKLFRGKLDYYVGSFLNRELGLYCEFARVENATLIGTAIAGLLN